MDAWHFADLLIDIFNNYFGPMSLITANNMDPRSVFAEFFNIIRPLFNQELLSPENSASEMFVAYKNCHSTNFMREINHIFLADSSLTWIGRDGILKVKRMQFAMKSSGDTISRQYKHCRVMKSTFENTQGGLETFLLSVIECPEVGEPLSLYEKSRKMSNFSILKNPYSIRKERENNPIDLTVDPTDHEERIHRLGNIVFYSIDDPLVFSSAIKDRYKESILGVFHYKMFAKCLESNFNTSDFSLLQINSCINELDELINVADSEMRSYPKKRM